MDLVLLPAEITILCLGDDGKCLFPRFPGLTQLRSIFLNVLLLCVQGMHVQDITEHEELIPGDTIRSVVTSYCRLKRFCANQRLCMLWFFFSLIISDGNAYKKNKQEMSILERLNGFYFVVFICFSICSSFISWQTKLDVPLSIDTLISAHINLHGDAESRRKRNISNH